MDTEKQFVDYYSALDAHPNFNAKRLEAAYRHFARLYHPDHPETADVTKFQATVEAYEVLRDAEKRAQYDVLYKKWALDFIKRLKTMKSRLMKNLRYLMLKLRREFYFIYIREGVSMRRSRVLSAIICRNY